MKKTAKKAAVLALTMCTLMSTAAPAVYAEAQFQQVKSEQTPPPIEESNFKARINAITHPQVSTMPKDQAYVPGGIELRVEVPEELSSKRNKKGSALKFKLLDAIIINDVVVVPEGATVVGHVSDQRSNGRFGRSGKLEISVDSVRALNNVEIPLEYVGRIEAGSDGGAVAVATVVSLLGGFFMKGKNVTIPAGTQLKVKVKGDTDLKVKLSELKDAMNPNTPHGVSITLK